MSPNDQRSALPMTTSRTWAHSAQANRGSTTSWRRTCRASSWSSSASVCGEPSIQARSVGSPRRRSLRPAWGRSWTVSSGSTVSHRCTVHERQLAFACAQDRVRFHGRVHVPLVAASRARISPASSMARSVAADDCCNPRCRSRQHCVLANRGRRCNTRRNGRRVRCFRVRGVPAANRRCARIRRRSRRTQCERQSWRSGFAARS